MGDALKQMIADGGSFPEKQIDHVTYFKYGYLLFITLEPVPEAHDIFKRFAKVFEQTYTRFLDLQKAEAQAREAQIEAAVERVRAQSMAMYNTSDLYKVNQEILSQLNKLKVAGLTGVSIYLVDENEVVTVWDLSSPGNISNPNSYSIKYDSKKYPIMGGFVEKWKTSDDDYFVLDFPKEALIGVAKEFEEILPEMAVHFNNAIESGQLQHQWNPAGRLSDGILSIDLTVPPTEDTKSIVTKMAGAFNLAYQRFLDLQKAEGQAREANIEAALEKVRSRTLGMQKSDELLEVDKIILQQIKILGIQLFAVGIHICHQHEPVSDAWMGDPTGDGLFGGDRQFPKVIYEHTHDKLSELMYKGWKEGETFLETTIQGEGLKEHMSYIRTIVPAPAKSDNTTPPKFLIFHFAYFSQGFFVFVSTEPRLDEHRIFIRFAKVFEQTYTRFNDLQKAEAQTREAQINLAVERVRARALAMFKSEEIIEVVAKLKDEIIGLNIPDVIAATIFLKEGNDNVRMWDLTSIEKINGVYQQHLDITFKLKSKDPHLYVKRVWENSADYFVDTQDRKGFKRIIAWLREHHKNDIANDVENFVESSQLKLLYHATKKLNSGKLSVDLLNPPPEEMESILTKMGASFDLAYKRFEDLKKAETQALRAEQDLIAIKEAKQKAEEALIELKVTQKQLIQSEKMASLGELTAGIAHEIQNPLNFVNNFSEVSSELIAEMKDELQKGNYEDVTAIANDVIQNLEKINHHGKRADAIVKGMLQHSRASTDKKELTDINALADEYLRLCYHGLRAKDKTFNATFKTDFDTSLEKININPQDIGRVILNLLTNAFYAVNEKKHQQPEGYEPTVTVSTKKVADKIEIRICDNGNGIPQKLVEKIFQPFFTTKPTGQGTGLGLSLSYDIIKAHGGEIKAETKDGEGSTFIIQLPITN
jgi:signal transduction histidine kinase